MDIPLKWCSGHKEYHPITEFNKDRRRKDGLRGVCRAYWKEFTSTPDYKAREKEWMKKWHKHGPTRKLLNPVQKKINSMMSVGIHRTLRHGSGKQGRSWEEITKKYCGYGWRELRIHLESLFDPYMSWDNWGRHGWHLDHKIPKSHFNFDSYEDPDFIRCWSLSNLQPMWEPENLAKHATVKEPTLRAFGIKLPEE